MHFTFILILFLLMAHLKVIKTNLSEMLDPKHERVHIRYSPVLQEV